MHSAPLPLAAWDTNPYGSDWPGNLLLPAIILGIVFFAVLHSGASRRKPSVGLLVLGLLVLVGIFICLVIFLAWAGHLLVFWLVVVPILVLLAVAAFVLIL